MTQLTMIVATLIPYGAPSNGRWILEKILESCPFCHRPFEAKLVSKEQVDYSSEPARVVQDASAGGRRGGYGLVKELPPEAITTYKSTYQCKHCGKEWTKTSVEEIALPREYAENEEDKTEYDAHVEEEQAREEEYNR